MNKFIDNWKNSGKTKQIIAIVSVSLTVAIGSCSYFYYSNYKEQEEIKLAKELKENQIKNAKKAITNYYEKAFEGASINQLVKVLGEINISRIPLLETGFNEDYYQCDINNCDFNYILRNNSIFNSQEKIFFGKHYKPIFSDRELSYSGVESELNNNTLSKFFQEDKEIKLVNCNDMLNYIYSYNSSKNSANDKITLTSLPENSVASQESSYPDYKHSYGFMVGKFTITQTDNPLMMKIFWQGKPFQNSFLITNLTKIKNTPKTVILEGKFICKK